MGQNRPFWTVEEPRRPAMTAASKPELHIVLCSPRGFCAGVVRAIDTVERALELMARRSMSGTRSSITATSSRACAAKGAIFVEELDEIPETDAPVVFSAHGVPKSVPAEAERRNFFALDATCPLVTKVHREAEIHFKRGREIVLIGHAGHPEVVGTLGQLPPGAVIADRDGRAGRRRSQPKDAVQARLRDPDHAVDRRHRGDRRDPQAALPEIVGPHKEDICYATTNRQLAVKKVAPRGRCDDRGRRAELVELAASARGRRARRLPARGAGATAPPISTGRCSRASAGSASPPALRRRRCWSRRSSMPSPNATRSGRESVSAASEDGIFFPLPRPLRPATAAE